MNRMLQVGVVIGWLVFIDILFRTLNAILNVSFGASNFTNALIFASDPFSSSGGLLGLGLVALALITFLPMILLVTRIFSDLMSATKHIVGAVFLAGGSEEEKQISERRLIVRLFGDDELFGDRVVPGLFWRVMRNLFYTWLLLIMLQVLSGIAAFRY